MPPDLLDDTAPPAALDYLKAQAASIRAPERRRSILEARYGLKSSPQAAPKLRILHFQRPGKDCRNLICLPRRRPIAISSLAALDLAWTSGRLLRVNASTIVRHGCPFCAPDCRWEAVNRGWVQTGRTVPPEEAGFDRICLRQDAGETRV